jgi:hypothetical protein
MHPIAIVGLLWAVAQPIDAPPAPEAWPAEGLALEYGPHTMDHSAAWWGVGWVKGMAGFTSVPLCSHIGQMVSLTIRGKTAWYRVADCTKEKDKPALRNWHRTGKAVVAEVANEVAVRQHWDWYYLDGPGHAATVVNAFLTVAAYLRR